MTVLPGAGVQAGTLVNALLHQVSNLSGIGGQLRCRNRSNIKRVAQTPLMLIIMSLAYQGARGDELETQGDFASGEVFRLYVEQMFQRRGTTSLVFPNATIIDWLLWLAGKMREHSQSVFLVEGLQPSWVGTSTKRTAYGPLAILMGGLVGRLIEWASFGLIKMKFEGLFLGLLGAVLTAFEVSLNHIYPVETISWKWDHLWKKTAQRWISVMFLGLGVGFAGALIFGLVVGLNLGLVAGLTGGLIALIFGLIVALMLLAGGAFDVVLGPRRHSLTVYDSTNQIFKLATSFYVGLHWSEIDLPCYYFCCSTEFAAPSHLTGKRHDTKLC
jgi:hypothetical protein